MKGWVVVRFQSPKDKSPLGLLAAGYWFWNGRYRKWLSPLSSVTVYRTKLKAERVAFKQVVKSSGLLGDVYVTSVASARVDLSRWHTEQVKRLP